MTTALPIPLSFNRPAQSILRASSGTRHQTITMHSPTRDPVRGYQKQKEKLALIGLECIIEWTKKTILTRKAEASRLNDELGDIHQYLQALEDEEGMILEDLSQQSAWTNSVSNNLINYNYWPVIKLN
jgi:hypothetical protein